MNHDARGNIDFLMKKYFAWNFQQYDPPQ